MRGNRRWQVFLALILATLFWAQPGPMARGDGLARAEYHFGDIAMNIMDIFADAFSSIGAKHIRESEKHYKSCEEWCGNDTRCVKCSRRPSCGQGYKKLKGWTGYGKNWYACAIAKNRTEAGRINHESCESWCTLTPECDKCSSKVGCGSGYEKIKSWTGYGENWYACQKRRTRTQASKDHKQACQEWCDSHSNCAKCSRKTGCGVGYKKIKSWTGYGDNWYACQKR